MTLMTAWCAAWGGAWGCAEWPRPGSPGLPAGVCSWQRRDAAQCPSHVGVGLTHETCVLLQQLLLVWQWRDAKRRRESMQLCLLRMSGMPCGVLVVGSCLRKA